MMHPTPFEGPLATDLQAYVDLKRALGRRFITAQRVLRNLDRFVRDAHPTATDLSAAMIAAWLATRSRLQPQSAASLLTVVRQFCLYRQRTDPHVFVPDPQRDATLWPTRVARRLPFIYTPEQVRELLRAALNLAPTARNPLRPKAMFIFLLLLYTSGLRFSEAAGLSCSDIDLAAGTLRIRDAKFFKTRLVPLAPDVVNQLSTHLHLRKTASASTGREQRLFADANDQPYANSTISETGIHLLRSIGLKPADGHCGARLHDLRHTFAVHRITRWYEEGADVQNLLPKLATYMGHKDIRSTQYYITITSAILSHANERFETACAPTTRGAPCTPNP